MKDELFDGEIEDVAEKEDLINNTATIVSLEISDMPEGAIGRISEFIPEGNSFSREDLFAINEGVVHKCNDNNIEMRYCNENNNRGLPFNLKFVKRKKR